MQQQEYQRPQRVEPAWTPRNVLVGLAVAISTLGSSGAWFGQRSTIDEMKEFKYDTASQMKRLSEQFVDLQQEVRTNVSQTLNPMQARLSQLEAQWTVVRQLLEESRAELRALRTDVQQLQRNGPPK